MARHGFVFVGAACLLGSAAGFGFAPLISTKTRSSSSGLQMEYIPDGLSKAQWKELQEKERIARLNLGRVGVTRFKSRSLQAYQESGAGHLFPVDPVKVKNGEIPLEKVPYMQRNGAWDNSDLLDKKKIKAAGIVGGKVEKVKWTKTDKEYANGGEVRAQSVNIFGGGSNLPWTAKFRPMQPSAIDPRKVQEKVGRPKSNLEPDPKALARVEEERKRLEKQINSVPAKLNGSRINGSKINGSKINGSAAQPEKKKLFGLF